MVVDGLIRGGEISEVVGALASGRTTLLVRCLRAVTATGGVAALIDEVPCPHLAHFVDAVGELIAAILHMHARGAMRHIASVHIGDA